MNEMKKIDILKYNSDAWDKCVQDSDRWTIPVSEPEIEKAAKGEFSILLTPSQPVPADWFPPLPDLKVLCLASGGGQQGPILAAAGAEVVVYDNSYQQLEQDRQVAEKYGLRLKTIKGDMADLSCFQDTAFDFIFHPCSNSFSSQVMSVWREAFRVLKPGGTLVSGFTNPILFLFDRNLEREGIFQLQYEMPYSDVVSLSSQELEAITASGEALMFAHSLEELIGGQLIAGFKLTGFYEDDWGGEEPIDRYFQGYIATRAEKLE